MRAESVKWRQTSKQQLFRYLTAHIFIVWKCLTNMERIFVSGIYTKMLEQIDVWSLYCFVLNLPEDGKPVSKHVVV